MSVLARRGMVTASSRAAQSPASSTVAKSLRVCRAAQDPGIRILERYVTPAGRGFQAAAVEDRKLAAFVADQLASAQRTSGSRNARAAHAEHVGQEFMSYLKLIGVRPIASHQQPAGEARLHEMKSSASSRLRQLTQRYIEVT